MKAELKNVNGMLMNAPNSLVKEWLFIRSILLLPEFRWRLSNKIYLPNWYFFFNYGIYLHGDLGKSGNYSCLVHWNIIEMDITSII